MGALFLLQVRFQAESRTFRVLHRWLEESKAKHQKDLPFLPNQETDKSIKKIHYLKNKTQVAITANVNRQAQKTQDSTLLERAKPKLVLHFLELTQVFGARRIRRRAINARLIQILFYLSELNV